MDNKHERLADRFADIFMRLSSHEKLDTHELAAEYQVSDKTIRRDLLRMGAIYHWFVSPKWFIWISPNNLILVKKNLVS